MYLDAFVYKHLFIVVSIIINIFIDQSRNGLLNIRKKLSVCSSMKIAE